MTFGRRASAPLAPARTAPRVPVLPVLPHVRTAWTGTPRAPRPVRFITARRPSPVAPILAGLALGFSLVAAFAYASPAPSYDLVRVQDGHAYTYDSGLTADDCRADVRAALAGFSCTLAR